MHALDLFDLTTLQLVTVKLVAEVWKIFRSNTDSEYITSKNVFLFGIWASSSFFFFVGVKHEFEREEIDALRWQKIIDEIQRQQEKLKDGYKTHSVCYETYTQHRGNKCMKQKKKRLISGEWELDKIKTKVKLKNWWDVKWLLLVL